MKFYKNLYVSDGYQKKKEDLVNKIKKGKYPISAFVLVLIENGPNQMEFYPAAMLYQGYLTVDDLYIIGIAESYMDAVYMVEDITKEVYHHTGTADIRSYIKAQEKEIRKIDEQEV